MDSSVEDWDELGSDRLSGERERREVLRLPYCWRESV
jgi:hypothetical protein